MIGVRRLLRSSKDAALALTARTFLNAKLRGIGEVTELAADTKKRTINVCLELVGEAEPIEIRVRKYRVRRTAKQSVLTIVDATASRRWLARALRRFIVSQSFSIPPKAGAILKLLT